MIFEDNGLREKNNNFIWQNQSQTKEIACISLCSLYFIIRNLVKNWYRLYYRGQWALRIFLMKLFMKSWVWKWGKMTPYLYLSLNRRLKLGMALNLPVFYLFFPISGAYYRKWLIPQEIFSINVEIDWIILGLLSNFEQQSCLLFSQPRTITHANNCERL